MTAQVDAAGSTTTLTEQNQEAIEAEKNRREEMKTIADIKAKVLDLHTTDLQILDMLSAGVKDGFSPAEMLAMQFAMQERVQRTSFLTNVLKLIHDTAMNIIHNHRQ